MFENMTPMALIENANTTLAKKIIIIAQTTS